MNTQKVAIAIVKLNDLCTEDNNTCVFYMAETQRGNNQDNADSSTTTLYVLYIFFVFHVAWFISPHPHNITS